MSVSVRVNRKAHKGARTLNYDVIGVSASWPVGAPNRLAATIVQENRSAVITQENRSAVIR